MFVMQIICNVLHCADMCLKYLALKLIIEHCHWEYFWGDI